jgi:hypothetical protein
MLRLMRMILLDSQGSCENYCMDSKDVHTPFKVSERYFLPPFLMKLQIMLEVLGQAV